MQTQEVYHTYGDKLYFFILKRVKDKEVANDILQNSFVKIHKNLPRLKNPENIKAWTFQIARNEVANYFDTESKYVAQNDDSKLTDETFIGDCCCFDRFMNELPEPYKEVIEQVYVNGSKQHLAAKSLGLSLANVKARIRRAKEILKEQFIGCCNYKLNERGKLVGEADCARCG